LAKPVSVARETVNLSDVLNNALLQLAGNTTTGAITVRREYAADITELQGDARRLELAFLNLMNNAVDAMPDGGVLTIRATATEDAIEISIADTGCGIDKADVQNVVKPFFSTKASGTGLGLPLVARVVAAHYGRLHIESEKGEGTTVRVRLPLALPDTVEPEETTWVQQESSSSMTTSSSAR
jgi:signal transduction histidine kinase